MSGGETLDEPAGDIERAIVRWWAGRRPTESQWDVAFEEVKCGSPFLSCKIDCGVFLQYKRLGKGRVHFTGKHVGKHCGKRLFVRTLGGEIWEPGAQKVWWSERLLTEHAPSIEASFREFCETRVLKPLPNSDPSVNRLFFDLHAQVGAIIHARDLWKKAVAACWKSILAPHPDAFFFDSDDDLRYPIHVAVDGQRVEAKKGVFQVFSNESQLWEALFDSQYQRRVALAFTGVMPEALTKLASQWAIELDAACKQITAQETLMDYVYAKGGSSFDYGTDIKTAAHLRTVLAPCMQKISDSWDRGQHVDYPERFAFAGYVHGLVPDKKARQQIWYEFMQKEPRAPRAPSADVFYASGASDYVTLGSRKEELHPHSCQTMIKNKLCPFATTAKDIEDLMTPRTNCGAHWRQRTGLPSPEYNTRSPASYTANLLSIEP
jgi:hypothetical protein